MDELYDKFAEVLWCSNAAAENIAEKLLIGKSDAYKSQLFHRCLRDYELSGIEFFLKRSITITPEDVELVKAQYPSNSQHKEDAYVDVRNQVINRYNAQQQKTTAREKTSSKIIESHLNEQHLFSPLMRK